MTYLLLGCQLILMSLLILAALSKLLYSASFIATLRASPVLQRFAHPLAMITVLCEFELALSLFFSTSWSLPGAFLGVALLLGVFTIWLIVVYRKGQSLQCGCFGAHNSNVSMKSIIRNSVFIGIAFLGFISALLSTSLLPAPSPWAFVIGGAFAGCVMVLFVGYRPTVAGIEEIPSSSATTV